MALHRDIVNVQVEMLRQFQIQQVSGKCTVSLIIVLWATPTSLTKFWHLSSWQNEGTERLTWCIACDMSIPGNYCIFRRLENSRNILPFASLWWYTRKLLLIEASFLLVRLEYSNYFINYQLIKVHISCYQQIWRTIQSNFRCRIMVNVCSKSVWWT